MSLLVDGLEGSAEIGSDGDSYRLTYFTFGDAPLGLSVQGRTVEAAFGNCGRLGSDCLMRVRYDGEPVVEAIGDLSLTLPADPSSRGTYVFVERSGGKIVAAHGVTIPAGDSAAG